MTTGGWITMAVICAYVWGGVIFLVTIAMRRERYKAQAPDRPWEP